MSDELLVFDPKMLITGPFDRCPQCGQVQIGTSSVEKNVHIRRCRNCYHRETERLPPLEKKLIYLDQMVLSSIARELDPVWREQTSSRDGYWLEAFDQLDRLVKLQMIVCPESIIHEEESACDDRYETVLRRLYRNLSSGIRLHTPHEVVMEQLWEAFEAWFTDRDPDWSRITREKVVYGSLDEWSERLRLEVNMGHWPGRLEGIRDTRTSAHETLQQLWDEWASERMQFEDLFQKERIGFATGVLQSFLIHVRRWHRTTGNVEEVVDPLDLFPSWQFRLVTEILRRLEEKGIPHEEQARRAVSFFFSEQALCAPENHIGALLHAGLARRAASGQRRVPTRGTRNDIAFIAAYLPYCDAMFIDNEFAHLLSEGPLAAEVNEYSTRIFSTRSRDEFLTYLVGLEDKASPDHVDLVNRTYGENWTKPFRSILEHERNRG